MGQARRRQRGAARSRRDVAQVQPKAERPVRSAPRRRRGSRRTAERPAVERRSGSDRLGRARRLARERVLHRRGRSAGGHTDLPEVLRGANRRPEDTVLQAAESAFREIVGKSKMDFVLYEGREQIAVAAQTLMQQILDRYKTGISISKVTMQNAQPPEQVQAAFDDAVRAKQDLERQKNEGQAYFNDVVPKARGTASRLTEEANDYRQSVIANAEGEAARCRQIPVET